MNQKSWKKLFPFSKIESYNITPSIINGENVNIRPKILSDGESDYYWRSDPELSNLDATTPITLTLKEYLKYHESELKYPSNWSVRFGIETNEKIHIGNCMYYDIDFKKKSAELGIMIGNKKYWSKGYGSEAVKLTLIHIFSSTEINLVYLHTLKSNFRAQKSFIKSGFIFKNFIRKNGYDFVRMEITKSSWENIKKPQNETSTNYKK